MKQGFDKIQEIDTPEIQAKIAEQDEIEQTRRQHHIKVLQNDIANLLEKHLHVRTESGTLNFEWVQQLAVASLSDYIRIQRVKIEEMDAYIKKHNSESPSSRVPESADMHRTHVRESERVLKNIQSATDLQSLSTALDEIPPYNLGYYGWTSENPQIERQAAGLPLDSLRYCLNKLQELQTQE